MAQRCCLLLLIKQNCLLRPILHGHFRHFLLKVGLSPPPPPKKKYIICLKENPLKTIINAFHFILKALFILKIFLNFCLTFLFM